jgi:alpha/beta superfamily hydrolase
LLEEPQVPALAGCAVVCHPHPLHGGTLHNKVVHTLARALQELDLATVRFNYRGVGASAGSYGEGRGEIDDARAVVDFTRERYPAARLVLAGFSFGAMVAAHVAGAVQPGWLITVAPAVERPELAAAAVTRPACPWLVLQGDADEIVDHRAVQRWAQTFSPPPTLRLLSGVGHFFHGRLPELKDAVTAEAAAAGFGN